VIDIDYYVNCENFLSSHGQYSLLEDPVLSDNKLLNYKQTESVMVNTEQLLMHTNHFLNNVEYFPERNLDECKVVRD